MLSSYYRNSRPTNMMFTIRIPYPERFCINIKKMTKEELLSITAVSCRWVGTRKKCLHCWRTGATSFLHQPIDVNCGGLAGRDKPIAIYVVIRGQRRGHHLCPAIMGNVWLGRWVLTEPFRWVKIRNFWNWMIYFDKTGRWNWKIR